MLEPGEAGSGLQFESCLSEDVLDRNWQRLILTHLEEKTHLGVLTGSPVTDMRITLIAGRAHLKHTEGGDFRQAVYRALRQGLMQAESVLLEPVFSFALEVPTENLGRAMSDVRRMYGSFGAPVAEGEYSVLSGTAPVSEMQGYQRELNAYTGGRGRLTCALKGYEPCHNAEEVIKRMDYHAEADPDNPSSSVFCAHGAGFLVGWDEVAAYAHLESSLDAAAEDAGEDAARGVSRGVDGARGRADGRASDYITQEEIEEIFQRTYGKSGQDYAPYRYHLRNTGRTVRAEISEENPGRGDADGGTRQAKAGKTGQEEYLLVDGYNIIFAWEELRALAEINIDSARDRLADICSDYQGSRGGTLILVFDAYKVKGNPGSSLKYHNIYVVYTREAETADQYIEKMVHEMGRKHRVTVATSDGLEQMIIWGEGAARLSARGFKEEVEAARRQTRELLPENAGLTAPVELPEPGEKKLRQ